MQMEANAEMVDGESSDLSAKYELGAGSILFEEGAKFLHWGFENYDMVDLFKPHFYTEGGYKVRP
jgi:hypothetical protein